MVAALFKKRRPQKIPVHVVSTARVAKRLVDALLHSLQTADVDVAIGVAKQSRDLRAAFANPVLHVFLRFAGSARKRKIDVDEILRQLQERPEAAKLSGKPRFDLLLAIANERRGRMATPLPD